jgi:predicted permease
MNMFTRLRSLLRALIGRDRFEREMSEELQFHLDAYADDLVRSGADPAEAVRRARVEFGGVERVREEARQSRGLRYLDELQQDVRYGLRQIAKSPGFTAAALISLALGIGANTAIFSLLDFVVIGTLPVRNPAQLYFLGHGTSDAFSLSSQYPLLARYQRNAQTLSGVTAFNIQQFKVTTSAGNELVDGQYVSGNYHDVLGVRFLLGRGFSSEPDQPSAGSQIAVISASFWQRCFASDPHVIGRTLTVQGRTVTIVGVTAANFHGLRPGRRLDVTLPLAFRMLDDPDFATMRTTWTSLNVVGRLKPGATASQVEADIDRIFQPYWMEPENASARRGPAPHPARITPAGQGTRTLRNTYADPLSLLMGMVPLVLLIACANVANLLSARGIARRRELAIRLSIGAGRARLVRQLLTESIMLAGAGGALGLIVAMWGTAAIASILGIGSTPIVLDVAPNVRVLAFSFGVSLVTGVVFGLLPALTATRVDLIPALRVNESGARRAHRLTSGRTLVAGQMAISLLLLVGTGLLVGSLVNLKTQDPGFQRDRLLLFWLDTRGTKSSVMELYMPMLERLRASPGVHAASVSTMTPLATNSETRSISVPPSGAAPKTGVVENNRITSDYFTTLGIPLLRGRAIAADDVGGGPLVAVVNETMAREFFGGEALGRVFWFGREPGPPVTIVGVVRDVRQTSLRDRIAPMAYTALSQAEEAQPLVTVAIRAQGDPRSIEAGVMAAVRATSPDLVTSYVRTMEEQVDASLIRERLLAALSVAFGVLALVLAAVGLYGVMAYAVARRIREFAIRLALGARRSEVLGRVLRETLGLAAAGIAIGLIAAMAATKLVSTFLYGLAPTDPATFAIAAVVLLTTSLAAGFLPARRAATVSPAQALKHE